jgi:microcin C transport system substrate-binding protein
MAITSKLKSFFLSFALLTVMLLLVVFMVAYQGKSSGEIESTQANLAKNEVIFKAKISRTPLPSDLEWLTNDSDPVFSAPETEKGGTFRIGERSFPLTFRTVGPDSNSEFRGAILGNHLSLTGLHPNTMNIIPELATHWAFGKDKKTMYFRLNKAARWSDGVSVTAHDFAYTIEFMRSKHIVAPWYNNYYTEEIENVIVYDDHTLAVISTKAQPDLHLKLSLTPTPRHYFGQLKSDFVRKYNWKIVPNTGSYQISDFKKGKYVKFKRKKDWWAKDLRYFKNRFNVNRVIFTVVREDNLEWEHFKKARIDAFDLKLPKYWHVKSHTPVIDNGYVNRIWFYNDTTRSPFGLWLNQDKEIFKDKYVRYAFAHAMNMQKVIEEVLRNDFTRLEHGYVGYGRYSNNNIKARRFDLEKINYYMKKVGWGRGTDGIWVKNGRRFSVEVTYGSEHHTPKLVVLKEEAKKAGVELRLSRLDPSAWYKKLSENRHEAVWMGFGTNLRPSYWQSFHSINAHKPQTNNVTNTDDPDLDRLIEKYRNSLDEEERIKLSLIIQQKIHEIGAFVPEAMRPYVREAYWRWWRLPKVPGTKHSGGLFAPFNSFTGGLFWYDRALHEKTKQAMKKKRAFSPVTLIDKTYMVN